MPLPWVDRGISNGLINTVTGSWVLINGATDGVTQADLLSDDWYVMDTVKPAAGPGGVPGNLMTTPPANLKEGDLVVRGTQTYVFVRGELYVLGSKQPTGNDDYKNLHKIM